MRSDKPLIRYALLSWQTHVLALETLAVGEADDSLIKLLETFLGTPTKASPSYVKWYEFAKAQTCTWRPRLDMASSTGLDLQSGATRLLTPLHFGCHLGLSNILWRWWCNPDLDVNMQAAIVMEDHYIPRLPATAKWTLLSHATYLGHHAIMKCLLRRGADANLAAKDGWTPLEVAAYLNSKAAALMLIRHGAHVNGPPEHRGSALFTTVRYASLEVLKILLSKGGNANAGTADESNLLVMAIRSRNNSSIMTKWLLQAGADVTAISPGEFRSPLIAAANYADLKSLRRLLKAGADPRLQVSGTWGSALAAAAASDGPKGRTLQAIQLLIEYGADPNTLLSRDSGREYECPRCSRTQPGPRHGGISDSQWGTSEYAPWWGVPLRSPVCCHGAEERSSLV